MKRRGDSRNGSHERPAPYGLDSRSEVVPFVPWNVSSVLDVGCGGGGFGRTLRGERPGARIVGIEPDASSAHAARSYYDDVIEGEFPQCLDESELWDVIAFNDVLEHLVDPWNALVAARGLLNPGGLIVASVPNIRYVPVIWDLVMRGTWTYTDRGTLDRTHLRFFTRSSVIEMFRDSGLELLRIEGVHSVGGRRWQLVRFLPWGFSDMRWLQFVVAGRPDLGI